MPSLCPWPPGKPCCIKNPIQWQPFYLYTQQHGPLWVCYTDKEPARVISGGNRTKHKFPYILKSFDSISVPALRLSHPGCAWSHLISVTCHLRSGYSLKVTYPVFKLNWGQQVLCFNIQTLLERLSNIQNLVYITLTGGAEWYLQGKSSRWVTKAA